MSKNLPSVLDPDRALASQEAWEDHSAKWSAMISAGVLPKHIRDPAQAIAIARYGQTFGWDPMKSVHNIHVVEGRCELSAAAMMGLLIERARVNGDVVTPVEMSRERAAIVVQRKGLDPNPVEVEFTLDDAKGIMSGRSGIKTNWEKFLPDMLWARCVSRVARRLYPDVVQGAYVQGEMMDAHVEQATSAPTSEIMEAVEAEYSDEGAP